MVFEVIRWRNEANKGKNMRTLNDYFLTSEIPDVSTASSTFVNVPDGGRIIKIFAHNQSTTTGTAAITFEIDGVACTSAAISHVASGSAGKKYAVEPTSLNSVNEGSVIEAITNGGSTNTSIMKITYVIRR